MPKEVRPVYVSYEQAQQLIPVFQQLRGMADWKDMRFDAAKIIGELESVRNIEYRLGGQQIFLTPTQYSFFKDVIRQVSTDPGSFGA